MTLRSWDGYKKCWRQETGPLDNPYTLLCAQEDDREGKKTETDSQRSILWKRRGKAKKEKDRGGLKGERRISYCDRHGLPDTRHRGGTDKYRVPPCL